MTNEEKARELATKNYQQEKNGASSYTIAVVSALEMADWKDKEWEEKIREWLTFNTNWASEYDENGRNPDYGKIDEMFNDIKKGLI